MRLRHKLNKTEHQAHRFNLHSIGEIIVDGDTDEIRNYEVYLDQAKEWKDLSEALQHHDVITCNYNIEFREPESQEERDRGFYH